jgi:hypothetical protein
VPGKRRLGARDARPSRIAPLSQVAEGRDHSLPSTQRQAAAFKIADVETSVLPEPLVPAGVELRDAPVPADMLIRLSMETFGFSYPEAKSLVLRHMRMMHKRPGIDFTPPTEA